MNPNTTFKEKVKRKLFEFLKTSLPYRSDLKPSGISDPEEAAKRFDLQGSFYKCIYNDYYTELVIDKNLFEKVSPFTIYDTLSVRGNECVLSQSTKYEVLKIPNGRLYTNNVDYISVITADNKLVERVSYQFKVGVRVDAEGNKIFKQRYFIKPQYIDGTVFSLLAGYGATHNIAHWFFDSIPRIHLLKESGLFNEIDYFVVPALTLDYHKDSLNLLGISDDKILVGKEDLHLIAKNLVVSSHPRGGRSFLLPKWISEFLRNEYLRYSAVDPLSPKRIYISRKDSKLRRVINEDELEKVLARYGFQTIILSQLSLIGKIKLFYNAEIIVCASGAGLTSLFFCQKDSTLIELFPEGFVLTHYYNVAMQSGMKYHSLVCKNESPAKDMDEGQLENLFVDLTEIDKILSKI